MKFNDFLFNEDNHTFRSKNHILQDIFKDWWQSFCDKYKNIRPVVYDEVNKFIGCGSKDNGYSVYECDSCGNYMFVPFTCKSRFCPSCGVNSCIRVANEMPTRCLDVKHRHITFTISDKLCSFFKKIALFLIFSLKLPLILYFLGLKKIIKMNNLLPVSFLLCILLVGI